tara:strand:+ start:340452 stop:342350 length:1899 start_codon:yes stop_codon:yes gene_type:complete
MNKARLIYLMLFLCVPFLAHGEELATTTPEVSPVVATSTPEFIEEATTTESIASTTESIPPVSITLTIETPGATLTTGTLSVSACDPYPGSATKTVTGYCAVLQSGIDATWSWFGEDAFIDSIATVHNDYGAGAYWNWFADLSFGMSALNTHILTANESLLITIGQLPLRISSFDSALQLGSSTVLTVEEFGFDNSFNPVWIPSASSTIHIGTDTYETDSDGTLTYAPGTSGSVSMYANKDTFLQSSTITLEVTEVPVPVAVVASGSGSVRVSTKPVDPVASALSFLLSQRTHEGLFSSALLTEWGAIGLARTGTSLQSFEAYLERPSSSSNTTDYERLAMARSALGLPITNEVAEIVSRFDGTQIGDPGLVNDDIFALIPLNHAGYSSSDPLIRSVVAFILTKQSEEGSWGSVDISAAAVQALYPFRSVSGISSALNKARGFLRKTQQETGCFGNTFSTSWVIMALHTLGEAPQDWKGASGVSAYTCLRSLQSTDGGFESSRDSSTRIWATAYALPALQGLTWDDLLSYAPKAEITPTTPSTFVEEKIVEAVPEIQPVAVEEIVTSAVQPNTIQEVSPRPEITQAYQPKPNALVAGVGSAVPEPITSAHDSLWQQAVAFLYSLLQFFRLAR